MYLQGNTYMSKPSDKRLSKSHLKFPSLPGSSNQNDWKNKFVTAILYLTSSIQIMNDSSTFSQIANLIFKAQICERVQQNIQNPINSIDPLQVCKIVTLLDKAKTERKQHFLHNMLPFYILLLQVSHVA